VGEGGFFGGDVGTDEEGRGNEVGGGFGGADVIGISGGAGGWWCGGCSADMMFMSVPRSGYDSETRKSVVQDVTCVGMLWPDTCYVFGA